MEVWDLKRQRLVTKMKASDSTKLEWYADGEHFLTATTAPRLRVANGYKLWNYTGQLLVQHAWDDKEELLDATWQLHSLGVYKQKQLNYATSGNQQITEPPVQAYRPPGARGQPSTFKTHENEPPSNLKQQDGPVSKAAQKNKKKREAKKAKKEQDPEQEQDLPSTANYAKPPTSTFTVTATYDEIPEDPEMLKKYRNLKKKTRTNR